jgi:hypothetical protein
MQDSTFQKPDQIGESALLMRLFSTILGKAPLS